MSQKRVLLDDHRNKLKNTWGTPSDQHSGGTKIASVIAVEACCICCGSVAVFPIKTLGRAASQVWSASDQRVTGQLMCGRYVCFFFRDGPPWRPLQLSLTFSP